MPHLSRRIENRGGATRIDQELNPPVSGTFQRPPQVTESARLNHSRWRHGFEPVGTTQVRGYIRASCERVASHWPRGAHETITARRWVSQPKNNVDST